MQVVVWSSAVWVWQAGDESKTEITAVNHVEGKNILWKSMIANRGQEQDDSLKEIIESASSEPFLGFILITTTRLFKKWLHPVFEL